MSRSFNIAARKARNLHLTFYQRWSALRHCMDYMAGNFGFSFHAIESALTDKFGILWTGPPYISNLDKEQQLIDAIGFLEVERNKRLERERAFQKKRIREKVQGKRQPSRADMTALNATVRLSWPDK